MEQVVCPHCRIEGKKVGSIEWPPGCLVVSIRRGEEEIIPRGNTRICAGDFLYILVDQDRESHLKSYLLQACNANTEN